MPDGPQSNKPLGGLTSMRGITPTDIHQWYISGKITPQQTGDLIDWYKRNRRTERRSKTGIMGILGKLFG